METIRTYRLRGQERYDEAELRGKFIPWKERQSCPDRYDWDGSPIDMNVKLFWNLMVKGEGDNRQQFLDENGKLWAVTFDLYTMDYRRVDTVYSMFSGKHTTFGGDADRDRMEAIFYEGTYSKEYWIDKKKNDINFIKTKPIAAHLWYKNWVDIKDFNEVARKLEEYEAPKAIKVNDSELDFMYRKELKKEGKYLYSKGYTLPEQCRERFDLAMELYLSGRKDIDITTDQESNFYITQSNTQ